MYKPIFRSHFDKDIKKLRRKNKKDVIKLIEVAINDYLKHDPYKNSKSLTGLYLGKRKYKKRYNQNELRVVFAICEECKSLNHQRFNSCNDCQEHDDNTLIFLKRV